MKQVIFLIPALCLFINAMAQNDCNNEQARRHSLIAEGMREKISTPDDWQLVADEYEKALQYAPNCPAICYNLGICYEELGKTQPDLCDKAISYYQKYLQLSPNAANKSDVQDLIYKIEGEKVMYQKQKEKQLEEDFKEYIGKWLYFYKNPYHDEEYKYYDSGDEDIEIFVSEGKLQAKVKAVDTDYYWAGGVWQYSEVNQYQNIPVSVDNNYIYIHYSYLNNTADYNNKIVWDKNTEVNNYKLRLSSNRLVASDSYTNPHYYFYWEKQ